MNDLDIDFARNTPWVDMSACVKFGLDQPSRLAGHTEQTNRQTYRLLLYRSVEGKYLGYSISGLLAEVLAWFDIERVLIDRNPAI